MNKKLSVKILLSFSLIIFLALISFFVHLELSNAVNKNTAFVARSEVIIRNSVKIHKSIIEMQSAFRGYLLTENETFLQPYFTGLKEIPVLFQEEKQMLRDSPQQIQKLDSIQLLHSKWIAYANTLIETKRNTLLSKDFSTQYLHLFKNKLQKEVGKKLNDEIYLKFKEFDRNEYLVRQVRRDNLNNSIIITRQVTLGLAIATLLLGLAGAAYITRTITKRIGSMVNLAENISNGKFDVIHDTKNDELTQLSSSLNVMSEKLRKSFSELDQFAYVVSHDLKAPLRGMYNIVLWIEEDFDKELSVQMKKYLETIKGRIERMENLINGLLEYSRIGRIKNPVEMVNVNEILADIIDSIVPKGFNVHVKEMPLIYTEKIKLHQVFSNLISNSVKYCKGNEGTIEINCKENDMQYEFSVMDQGIGIEPEYHHKIFQIFQTLREKNETESTGVGLAIVKKIIEEKKGIINVYSSKGKGASFIFTWPKEMNKRKKLKYGNKINIID